MGMKALDEQLGQLSFDGWSSAESGDGLSSSEAVSMSLTSESGGNLNVYEEGECESSSSSAEGSSRWSSTNIINKCFYKPPPQIIARSPCGLKPKTELSELEMMKEKFSKLLLGEDMSGGGKGVCSALAISNAITNLSASVFGELWRLEPLSVEKRTMWTREMDWLLSVADHIVELVPSRQTLPDGGNIEVMVTRPRSDIYVNLPALKKLDGMLLETLDGFRNTEFWYVDQGIAVVDENNHNMVQIASVQRQDDKWWLPIPKVPVKGLSKDGIKQLQQQRECIGQILKASVAINAQILAEMEIPDVYFEALPKNGKASLGDVIYRHLTAEVFYPEAVLDMLDLSSEHKAVDTANRIEAAIHGWQRRHSKYSKHSKQSTRSSWGIVKDFMSDMDRREYLSERAKRLLLCLKQRFPNLRQTLLDITKIQHNRDIGQAVLESYSRVLESLAFNINARIEDVLYANDMVRQSLSPSPAYLKTRIMSSLKCGYSLNFFVNTPCGTPLITPSESPTPSSSPRRTPNSPLHSEDELDTFPEYLGVSLRM